MSHCAALRLTTINGQPGNIKGYAATGVTDAFAFDIKDGLIVAIYVVRNPESFRHLHGSNEL
jgi:hypothetical protein